MRDKHFLAIQNCTLLRHRRLLLLPSAYVPSFFFSYFTVSLSYYFSSLETWREDILDVRLFCYLIATKENQLFAKKEKKKNQANVRLEVSSSSALALITCAEYEYLYSNNSYLPACLIIYSAPLYYAILHHPR